MKPQFEAAAKRMKSDLLPGKLAAVDCTSERTTAKKFDVSGYPTVKYFAKGELMYDAGHARDEEAIVDFMKDPKVCFTRVCC